MEIQMKETCKAHVMLLEKQLTNQPLNPAIEAPQKHTNKNINHNNPWLGFELTNCWLICLDA